MTRANARVAAYLFEVATGQRGEAAAPSHKASVTGPLPDGGPRALKNGRQFPTGRGVCMT
jgi:hypothetical protein